MDRERLPTSSKKWGKPCQPQKGINWRSGLSIDREVRRMKFRLSLQSAPDEQTPAETMQPKEFVRCTPLSHQLEDQGKHGRCN